MPKLTSVSTQKSKEKAIQAIFRSIEKKGLVPLASIPSTVLVNPVTNASEGNICVNFVNLDQADKNDAELAMKVAIDEEFMGVYGICLERQWPFQRFTSPELLKAEASERLMHSVVFILAPPARYPHTNTEIRGAQQPTEIALYQPLMTSDRDGFSQSRDKSVITGQTMPYSNRVTEIKTIHHFAKNEVLAVLVPEHLQSMATETFTQIPIIPVAKKTLTLNSIPQLLTLYHNEKLKKPLTVEAPDYFGALSKFCAEKKNLTKFSLHAVRLHTNFDFIVRPITQVSTNQQLITSTNATVAVQYADDSAWIVVHKNFGVSKQNLLTKLQTLNVSYYSKIEKGCQPAMAVYTQLAELKGEATLHNVYGELSMPQLSLLTALDVKIIKLDHFYMLKFLPELTDKVEKVVKDFEKSIQEDAGLKKLFQEVQAENAALKIQTLIRGSRARSIFQELQEKTVKENSALKIQALIRGSRVKTIFQEVQKKGVEVQEKSEQLKKAQGELDLAREQLDSLSRGVSQQ